jgi:antitoxin (DNA-binding transcriptional repressor) of toxin-antitoxin stability system
MAEREVGTMAQKTIEIQELKEQLSSRLQEVREGTTLMIMDQGQPVARLVPFAEEKEEKRVVQDLPAPPPGLSLDEKIQRLVDAGVISWSGQRLPPEVPRVPLRGTKTVSEILLEDRD